MRVKRVKARGRASSQQHLVDSVPLVQKAKAPLFGSGPYNLRLSQQMRDRVLEMPSMSLLLALTLQVSYTTAPSYAQSAIVHRRRKAQLVRDAKLYGGTLSEQSFLARSSRTVGKGHRGEN